MMAAQLQFPFVEPIEPDKGGQPPLFKDPKELWDAAIAYFTWSEENPIQCAEKASSDGQAHTLDIPRPRPWTIGGLVCFLGIARRTWDNYREREEFLPVILHLEEAMRTQKFELAAVGVLNANLISRDLGLADRQKVGIGGDPDNDTPVNIVLTGRIDTEQPMAQEPTQ